MLQRMKKRRMNTVSVSTSTEHKEVILVLLLKVLLTVDLNFPTLALWPQRWVDNLTIEVHHSIVSMLKAQSNNSCVRTHITVSARLANVSHT